MMQLKFIGDYIMPMLRIGVPGPIAAMMREVDGLRLQDRDTVTASYKNQLSAVEEQRRLAQAELNRNLTEVANQEQQYIANSRLVENALADIDEGRVLSIKAIKDSNNKQTWELFCKALPLHIAILKDKLRVVKVLLNHTNPKFHIDYISDNDQFPPAYEIALSLKRHITQTQQEIRNVMVQRVLKDIAKSSETGQLRWFLNAVIIAPELINSPIPEQQGLTAAMQLAKDNHLAALITIDADFSEDGYFSIVFNKPDDFGKTMLDYALQQGHKELSLWLLEKTKLAISPIEKACINGDLTEVERLLAVNDNSVNPAIRENAPLLWAIMHNHNEVVTKLIASGQINIKANNNIAIITAVRYGHLEIAKQLIDAGADINAQNDLALKFAKAINTETKELRSKKQSILDFVYKAKFVTEKAINERKAKATNKIQYSWRNYRIRSAEAIERERVAAENLARAAAALQVQRELEEFHRTRPLTVANIEEARRLSVEQQSYLVRNSQDNSSIILVCQVNPSVGLSSFEIYRRLNI
jgi:ankyrin repeat protein